MPDIAIPWLVPPWAEAQPCESFERDTTDARLCRCGWPDETHGPAFRAMVTRERQKYAKGR